MAKQTNSKGFSILAGIAIVLVIATVGLGGWYVWDKNQKDDADKSDKTSQNKQDKNEEEQERVDPYEGWLAYNNATYGINFKYPADWKTENVTGSSSPTDHPITIEYAINVKRNEEVKYNNTIAVEVLHQSLDDAVAEYDKQFAQAPSNPVTKTTEQLKGKKSVQYTFLNSEKGVKQYLFAVGSKTYSFRSINEELNIQTDPGYWKKFDKVFESFDISPSD